eukprot:scaffold217347_cov27-Tisochrysis_lutea.AAC.3
MGLLPCRLRWNGIRLDGLLRLGLTGCASAIAHTRPPRRRWTSRGSRIATPFPCADSSVWRQTHRNGGQLQASFSQLPAPKRLLIRPSGSRDPFRFDQAHQFGTLACIVESRYGVVRVRERPGDTSRTHAIQLTETGELFLGDGFAGLYACVGAPADSSRHVAASKMDTGAHLQMFSAACFSHAYPHTAQAGKPAAGVSLEQTGGSLQLLLQPPFQYTTELRAGGAPRSHDGAVSHAPVLEWLEWRNVAHALCAAPLSADAPPPPHGARPRAVPPLRRQPLRHATARRSFHCASAPG